MCVRFVEELQAEGVQPSEGQTLILGTQEAEFDRVSAPLTVHYTGVASAS